MAIYIVMNEFIDKETKEHYTVNQEIEMTVKRAKEVEENLVNYGLQFLERIDNK